jgi:hypothetical protein
MRTEAEEKAKEEEEARLAAEGTSISLNIFETRCLCFNLFFLFIILEAARPSWEQDAPTDGEGGEKTDAEKTDAEKTDNEEGKEKKKKKKKGSMIIDFLINFNTTHEFIIDIYFFSREEEEGRRAAANRPVRHEAPHGRQWH